ncbi:hypothetical protein GCM10011613_06270 [Cellvibrio zantedeschiae]|uniref:RiboL-PSP-HEPN domain-containing protein n=1 Tax=Cellvibrio zantedeschiae TaxID=1237077 RepID=A0ABQ3ASE7_9GAMM|nr:hypothetical protein [Cellvibrio zantedeschiae]GGY65163.1 hypothetical protein GCM10011613_06270 [Cellvibrio zantedeschiae]
MPLVNDFYNNSKDIKFTYESLMINARKMLHKAKIATNIESALRIAKAMEKDAKTRSELFCVLLDYYEHIIDDVAIMSAFELFAKSKLLRKQYIIHDLESAKDQHKIRNVQKKQPIHIKSCLAKNYTIKETTLSTSVLLSPKYTVKYNLSDSCIKNLGFFNKTRNLLHMHEITTYGMHLEKLEAIIELKQAIENCSPFLSGPYKLNK